MSNELTSMIPPSAMLFDSAPPAAVLSCPSCYKPFNHERSHARHIRYCGSRKRTRPRSCRTCNAAKTKCSFGKPCLRCTKKGIDCSYESPAIVADTKLVSTEAKAKADSFFGAMSTQNVSDPWSLPAVDDVALAADVVLEDFMTLINSQPHLGTEDYTTTPPSRKSTSPDQLFTFDDRLFNPFATPSSNPQASSMSCGTYSTHWCTWSQNGVSLSLTNEIPTAEVDSRPWNICRTFGPIAHHNASLVIQSLRGIPTMMLRRETFPWFIHAHAPSTFSPATSGLAEPLVNCMSIAHMFVSRTTETKGILWATITTEIRRLRDNRHNQCKEEVLATVQVCMVYAVMCIIDQSTESQAASSELLANFNKIYMHFKALYISHGTPTDFVSSTSSWSEWAFTESQRRLTHLWFLVGCAVCIKAGIVCDPLQSCRDLALPGHKALWEAPNQYVWESELESSRILQATGLVTLGDLIDTQNSSHLIFSAQKLDKWNAGIDTLGSLLNLVGPMLD